MWKESRALCLFIRELTREPEFKQDFKFCNQINGSAGSVMDNIAEGFDRDGNKEFIQFLSIAKGSNSETRSQAYRAFDAKLISEKDLEYILEKTSKIKSKITALMIYLRKSERKGNKYS